MGRRGKNVAARFAWGNKEGLNGKLKKVKARGKDKCGLRSEWGASRGGGGGWVP